MKTYKWESIHARGEQPLNRDEHTCVLYEDSLIVFGGFINSGERMNDMYRYYFKENKWERVIMMGGDVPAPRSGHSAVIYSDSMFVFGGKDNDNNRLNDIWEFNFSTYQWTYIPALDPPLPRSGHSANIYKDYMIVFGGIYEVTKELDDMYLFDIRSKRWISFFEECMSPVGKNRMTLGFDTFSNEASPNSKQSFKINRIGGGGLP